MNFLDKIISSFNSFTMFREGFTALNSRARGLSLIENMIEKRKKILEVGCGLGLNCEYFKKKGYFVYGIDNDKELVERTRRYSSANLRPGSALDIPFPDSTFDVVIYMFVLHHINPKYHKQVLNQTSRVLKKDGVMILIEPKINSRKDLLFDRIFFSKSFYGYFSVNGKYEQGMKGSSRFFKIKKGDIRSLKFEYRK